jgi:ribonuclease BN (tRNA processing enzyme)
VYYPGTEALKPDEMRVVALGTGMPSARPKQAAACWLVELGNGDKFLFDIGSGCHERLAAQKIRCWAGAKVQISSNGGMGENYCGRDTVSP